MMPVTVPIAEDEDLRGYIIRNSKYSMMERNDFTGYQLGYTARRDTQYTRNLSKIAEYDLLELGMDLETLLIRHTPVMMNSIFYFESFIAKQMDILLHDAPKDYYPEAATGKEFLYCPECVKEDIKEYGEPVVHVPHMARGITCCYKHGKKLSLDPDAKESLDASEDEIRKAKLMHDIYENEAYGRLEETLLFVDRISQKKQGRHVMLRTTNGQMKSSRLYDYPEKFDEFLDSLSRRKDRPLFVGYECPDCGKSMIRHIFSVERSLVCPNCAKKMSREKRYFSDIRIYLTDDFECVDIPQKNHVMIRHKPCGTVRTIYVSSILNSGRLICPLCSKHIGEEKVQKNGHLARIISFNTVDDVTLEFEDGKIREHVSYGSFLMGAVAHTPYSERLKAKVGEKRRMLCGEIAEIVVCRKYNDIDVMFQDGTVSTHKSYSDFQSGNILPSESKGEYYRKKRLGETRVMKDGHTGTIIEYRGIYDVDVEFDTGYIKRHIAYQCFRNGDVMPWHGLAERFAEIRIGEERIMKNGHKGTIIGYRNAVDIDVRFDTGYVKEHTRYADFTKGKLTFSESKADVLGEKLIGKVFPANDGHTLKIIAYRSFYDVDVEFDNGYVRRHTSMKEVKKGNLYPAKNKHEYLCQARVGEERTMKNGMKARITVYRNKDDIDVEFENGEKLEHRSYDSFVKGKLRP